MSNDSKPQPTGWVIVDFEDDVQPFSGPIRWFGPRSVSRLNTFESPVLAKESSRADRIGVEVHPWPLPASVLARLKAKYPERDWSQVPVADAPAVAEPSEVERLRADVERLTRERDDARASVASVSKQLLREADEAIRERDEARAELGKARLSRLDEFAKAALTGLLADPERNGDIEDFAAYAVEFAQATIRAIDGAGGA